MKRLRLYPLSSLAKVFPDEICGEPFSGGSLLANETFSFQLAYVLDTVPRAKLDCKLSIESPLRSCISAGGMRPQRIPGLSQLGWELSPQNTRALSRLADSIDRRRGGSRTGKLPFTLVFRLPGGENPSGRIPDPDPALQPGERHFRGNLPDPPHPG